MDNGRLGIDPILVLILNSFYRSIKNKVDTMNQVVNTNFFQKWFLAIIDHFWFMVFLPQYKDIFKIYKKILIR